MKLLSWNPHIDYGYKTIEIIAESKEDAIKMLEIEQEKYMKTRKAAEDYEKKIGWTSGRCGHKVGDCTCRNKVTPELRRLWNKCFKEINYEDELKIMKKEKPYVIDLKDVKPQIVEIGGYIE